MNQSITFECLVTKPWKFLYLIEKTRLGFVNVCMTQSFPTRLAYAHSLHELPLVYIVVPWVEPDEFLYLN